VFLFLKVNIRIFDYIPICDSPFVTRDCGKLSDAHRLLQTWNVLSVLLSWTVLCISGFLTWRPVADDLFQLRPVLEVNFHCAVRRRFFKVTDSRAVKVLLARRGQHVPVQCSQDMTQ